MIKTTQKKIIKMEDFLILALFRAEINEFSNKELYRVIISILNNFNVFFSF